jgi:hypothetical protein
MIWFSKNFRQFCQTHDFSITKEIEAYLSQSDEYFKVNEQEIDQDSDKVNHQQKLKIARLKSIQALNLFDLRKEGLKKLSVDEIERLEGELSEALSHEVVDKENIARILKERFNIDFSAIQKEIDAIFEPFLDESSSESKDWEISIPSQTTISDKQKAYCEDLIKRDLPLDKEDETIQVACVDLLCQRLKNRVYTTKTVKRLHLYVQTIHHYGQPQHQKMLLDLRWYQSLKNEQYYKTLSCFPWRVVPKNYVNRFRLPTTRPYFWQWQKLRKYRICQLIAKQLVEQQYYQHLLHQDYQSLYQGILRLTKSDQFIHQFSDLSAYLSHCLANFNLLCEQSNLIQQHRFKGWRRFWFRSSYRLMESIHQKHKALCKEHVHQFRSHLSELGRVLDIKSVACLNQDPLDIPQALKNQFIQLDRSIEALPYHNDKKVQQTAFKNSYQKMFKVFLTPQSKPKESVSIENAELLNSFSHGNCLASYELRLLAQIPNSTNQRARLNIERTNYHRQLNETVRVIVSQIRKTKRLTRSDYLNQVIEYFCALKSQHDLQKLADLFHQLLQCGLDLRGRDYLKRCLKKIGPSMQRWKYLIDQSIQRAEKAHQKSMEQFEQQAARTQFLDVYRMTLHLACQKGITEASTLEGLKVLHLDRAKRADSKKKNSFQHERVMSTLFSAVQTQRNCQSLQYLKSDFNALYQESQTNGTHMDPETIRAFFKEHNVPQFFPNNLCNYSPPFCGLSQNAQEYCKFR